MSDMNPFEVVKNINGKGPILNEQDVHGSMYIVIKAFSYYIDTLFLANEMNMSTHITDLMKYHFLYFSVDKAKRYRQWEKKEKELEGKIVKIQKYANCNRYRAKEMISIADKLNLWEDIEKELQTGGLTK